MTQLIDPTEFSTVVKRLRSFFDNLNFQEVHTQNRLSILAACEDPTTVATYNYNGKIWPLPQTGQMWLEYELLTKPDLPGCYCVSTSYRQEQNPTEGRHELIFPMFEFEAPGEFPNLLKMESDLLTHLGFKTDHGRAPYEGLDFPGGNYMSMVAHYAAENNELTDFHEGRMYAEYGDVFFLTHFPESTSPFWNMKMDGMTSTGKDRQANKCDVIIGGMETIGSAERSSDVEEMKHQFHTISDGGYASLLYDLFGKERVEAELEEFLSYDFKPRYGGGIGITRLIAGMKKAELL
jgi:aspartyl/asparaginyl-tRNA synthetase|tara:strand:- start:25 stop:903 length:879 start_codon:yes stop_codon:yes gene_type:complete